MKMGIVPPPISFEFQVFFCDFENGGYVPSKMSKHISEKYLHSGLWNYVGIK